MITEIQLKATLIRLLKSAFPDVAIYGVGAVEGYKKPCFFVEMILTGENDETVNVVKKTYSVSILYEAAKITEMDSLKKIDGIRNMLKCVDDRNRHRKMCIKIKDEKLGNRYVKATEFFYTFVGDDADYLNIHFNMEFYDTEEIEPTEPPIEDVRLIANIETNTNYRD